jgi:hypothetical protein
VGEKVQVAVNPTNPAQAVLEPGVDVSSFMWPAPGIAFMWGSLLPDRKRGRKHSRSTIAAETNTNSKVGTEVNAQATTKSRYRTAKVFFIIGTLILLYGANTLYTGWRSPHWPTTDGKILYSATRNAGRNYGAQLWYEYYVQGTRYVAEDYRVGGNSSPFQDVARAAVIRYPVGGAVKVYYDPANPSKAVLEPGLWYGNFILPALGIALLGCAFLAKKLSDATMSSHAPDIGSSISKMKFFHK